MFKRRNIELKTEKEIEKMKIAGKVVGDILQKLFEIIKPKITTKDIDIFVEKHIRSLNMVPAFFGVKGQKCSFPASTCVSINNEVVHGIPSAERKLKSGDIVSVDIGVLYEGYYGDAARTYGVGVVSDIAVKLIKVTEQSLYEGIKRVLPGNRLGDVSNAIQKTVDNAGFSVVRDFVGHGIGRALHEEPQVLNYGQKGTGVKLLPGMVLAIEPMVNAGSYEVFMLDDGWTVVTADGNLSAHFEHTVAVTEYGYEILTKV
ncbi:MAG: type I methionyl aminopeptidase [Endomicrobium sp.]|nr:type I methionyl aminopeptidase [Endomicrobium sp.]